jgi:hypothetical protein
MLKRLFFLMIGITSFLASCTKDTTEDVPANVLASFRTDFPTAEDETWVALENGIYEVAFVGNYSELMADYDASGVLRTVTNDLNHDGCHDGLDRPKHDGLNLDSLCAGVTDYIAANYAGYTINKAFKTKRDSLSSILVLISNDTSRLRLVFDLDCNFIKVAKGHIGGGHNGGGHGPGHGGHGPGHGGGHGHGMNISLDSLPASIAAYVNDNYSGFTLFKAKKLSKKGTKGYVVVIKNADGSYKRLLFDLNGVFVKEL